MWLLYVITIKMCYNHQILPLIPSYIEIAIERTEQERKNNFAQFATLHTFIVWMYFALELNDVENCSWLNQLI